MFIDYVNTKVWADFFRSTHPHEKVIWFGEEGQGHPIYIYNWKYRSKIAYLSRFPGGLQLESGYFWQQIDEILKIAKKSGCFALKIDLDSVWAKQNYIHDTNSFLDNIQEKGYKVSTTNRKMHYNSLMKLDIPDSETDKIINLESYKDLHDTVIPILQKFNVNNNILRYTKKALKSKKWEILSTKKTRNFEDFYSVLRATGQRQNFVIKDYSYYKQFLELPETNFFLLRNLETKEFESCWSSIYVEGVLTYFYGGNTKTGLKNKTQYMIHALAIALAINKRAKTYNLGGYERNKSYSKFKDGYRGQVLEFPGPVDIVIKPWTYFWLYKLPGLLG